MSSAELQAAEDAGLEPSDDYHGSPRAGDDATSFAPPVTSKSQNIPSSTSRQHPEIDRPPFSPFFTIITDPSTNTTVHPSHVHYIFSDDDPDALINACLRAQADSENAIRSSKPSKSQASADAKSIGPSTSTNTKITKANTTSPQERILVLDMNESGDAVVKAHSLSPAWQILKTEVTNAPTWAAAEEVVERTARGDNALMLKIEGSGLIPDAKSSDNVGLGIGDASPHWALDDQESRALMDLFDRRMAILRKIAEVGETESLQEFGAAAEQA